MQFKGVWFTASLLAVAALLLQVAGASGREGVATPAPGAISAAITEEFDASSLTAARIASDKKKTVTAQAGLLNDETSPFISRAQEARNGGTVGTRPGWGCGDENHEHTGPPGNPDKTSPCDTDELEDEEDQPFISPAQQGPPSGTVGTRPGWGCGDKNHEHTGPRGNPGATSPCDKNKP
jgi:hypothetical protein